MVSAELANLAFREEGCHSQFRSSSIDRSDLKLGRVGGSSEAFGKAVTWTLISELPDPSPYVEGGELVLTTGSRLAPGFAQRRGYVARLVDAGAVALGFGVSSFYPEVPADLVTAAKQADLPLLSIPADTPFGAISRAVADCISDERQKELNFAVAAQRDLTRASLSPYAGRAIVDRLAKAIRGWTVLLGMAARDTNECGMGWRGDRTDCSGVAHGE